MGVRDHRLVSCLAALLFTLPQGRQGSFAASLRVPDDFPYIQAALDSAAPGDTVLVAAGDYLETMVLATDSVWVVGEAGAGRTEVRGFSGTTITISDSVEAGGIRGFTIKPSPGIVTTVHAHPGAHVFLADLLIEGGTSGLRCEGADLEVADCAVIDCTIGISADTGAAPRIRRSRLVDNVLGLSASGGAAPLLRRNRLERNGIYNLQVASYTGPVVIDAAENWWGTPVESELRATIINYAASVGVEVVYSRWCADGECAALVDHSRTWGRLRYLLLPGSTASPAPITLGQDLQN